MKPPTFIGMLSALIFCALLYGVLEYVFGKAKQRPWWRPARYADVIYWFTIPRLTRWLVVAALAGLTYAVGFATSLPQDLWEFHAAMQARSPIATLPVWAQLITALLLGDFLMYWNHRFFHRGWLWKVHAVHHEPEELDWLVSARIHPLNDLPNKLATVLPILFLGVDLKVFAIVIPFMQLWTVSLHANVPFRFGPLAYVITTPRYHRWHHTMAEEGLDKNFAGLFPIWDLIFGTFYLPSKVEPHSFGASGVPKGILAQLWYPFAR